MKKSIITFLFLLLVPLRLFSTPSIYLKVGEKTTLNLPSPPNYLKGCIWKTSHPYDVVFDPTPGSYSTSATIKAVNPTGGTAPCVIQCEYSYYDLDPITGRYTYLRSGFYDWYVYVSAGNPTSVSITPSSHSMYVGEYVKLQANLFPSGASSTLEWWLDNINIASFTQTQQNVIGVVAHAPGVVNANVRTGNGLTASCMITIKSKDPTSIRINGPASMLVGEKKTLHPTIEPTGATATLTWESSNSNVVEVNNGELTAKSKGTARITVTTHNGKSDYCDITVHDVPKKIDLPASVSVYNTFSVVLNATLAPADAVTTVSWRSKDTSIASVAKNGTLAATVTGKKTGSTVIYVTTSNNLTDSCVVTVNPLPQNVTQNDINVNISNIKNLKSRSLKRLPK